MTEKQQNRMVAEMFNPQRTETGVLPGSRTG